MKNNSSKIMRMCAGVRDDCRASKLSPASGQCTFQSASRGETSARRSRTAAGIVSAKPAGGHAALPCRFVDGNDAAHFERCCGFVVRAVTAGVAQHFKLRLHDLQLSAALVLFDFAVKCDQLPGLELVLQISGVEPEAFQLGSALPNG
jgi:hypothetical protein